MIGLVGAILGFALLIFLSFKKVNLFIASILAATVIGITNNFPFFSIFNDHYIPGFISFIKSWFLVLSIGAVYSELMDRSGSVASISYKLVDLIGVKYVLFITVLVTGVLVYGGINTYAIIFVIWPMCIVFARESKIPTQYFMAAFFIGMFWTAEMPGSPAMGNLVSTAFLGVPATAGALFSIFLQLVYLALTMLVLSYIVKKQQKKNEKNLAEVTKENINANATAYFTRENVPAFATSIIPLLLVLFSFSGLSGGWFVSIGIPKFVAVSALLTSMFIGCLAVIALNFKKLRPILKDSIYKSSMAGVNPCLSAAFITGFVYCFTASAAYTTLSNAILGMAGSPLFQVVVVANTMTLLTGSQVVATNLTMQSFGATWLSAGVNPNILRSLVPFSAGAFGLSPASGGYVAIMGYGGLTLKESYPSILVAVAIPSLVTSIIGALIAALF